MSEVDAGVSARRMKLLLTVFTRTRTPAVCAAPRRLLSSGAGSGLLESPLPLHLLRGSALIAGSSRELVQRLGSQVEVRTGFITEEEEEAFMRELEPGLKKKRYEYDHWDDVRHVHNYTYNRCEA